MIWLIRRNIGGLGDAVMLEPTISELWENIGEHDEIWLQLLKWISPIFEHHPKVSSILTEKEDVRSFKTIKTVIDIRCDDDCPAAKYEANNCPNIVTSRQEIFTKFAGLNYDRRPPRLYLSKEEKYNAEQLKKYTPGIRVGIQLRAAEKWRDYFYMDNLIWYLCKKTNWHIFLYDKEHAPIIGRAIPVVDKPLREVMWMMSTMDVMICPDSGLAHISAALGVKTYCIFGPTDPIVRMAPYGNHVYWNDEFKLCKRSRCWYTPCKRVWCLRLLSPRQIYKDIKQIL